MCRTVGVACKYKLPKPRYGLDAPCLTFGIPPYSSFVITCPKSTSRIEEVSRFSDRNSDDHKYQLLLSAKADDHSFLHEFLSKFRLEFRLEKQLTL